MKKIYSKSFLVFVFALLLLIFPARSYCQKVIAFSPNYSEIDASNNETKYNKKVMIFLDKKEKTVGVVIEDNSYDYILDHIVTKEVEGRTVNYWYLTNNNDYDFLTINISDKTIIFSNKGNQGGRMYYIDNFTTFSTKDLENMEKILK